MPTKFAWIVPSFYQTMSKTPLCFDMTVYTKTLIDNEVWQRKFGYGFINTLDKLPSNDIAGTKITVIPLSEGQIYSSHELSKYLEKYLMDTFSIDINTCQDEIQSANLLSGRNLVLIEGQISKEVDISKDENYVESYLEDWHRMVALSEEIGALFRAALHLVFVSDYPLIPSLAKQSNQKSGGLFIVQTDTDTHMESIRTCEYMFPNSFLPDHIVHFEKFLQELSSIWHLSLWPIHRYLRALNTEHVEMEKLLDLLFALESLFDKNTSAEFIRLAAATLYSNRNDALRANEVLKEAFRIRNQIVHGGRYFTGMEKIKLEGKRDLSQRIFLETKRIVGLMIISAVRKLQRTPSMANLRINLEDLINRYYAKTKITAITKTLETK